MPLFLSIQDNAENDMFSKELRVLLQSGMFLAGAIGFVLDNTIPGVFRRAYNLGRFGLLLSLTFYD